MRVCICLIWLQSENEELQKGDVIKKIDQYDVRDLRHVDAQNLLQSSECVKLAIERSESFPARTDSPPDALLLSHKPPRIISKFVTGAPDNEPQSRAIIVSRSFRRFVNLLLASLSQQLFRQFF